MSSPVITSLYNNLAANGWFSTGQCFPEHVLHLEKSGWLERNFPVNAHRHIGDPYHHRAIIAIGDGKEIVVLFERFENAGFLKKKWKTIATDRVENMLNRKDLLTRETPQPLAALGRMIRNLEAENNFVFFLKKVGPQGFSFKPWDRAETGIGRYERKLVVLPHEKRIDFEQKPRMQKDWERLDSFSFDQVCQEPGKIQSKILQVLKPL